MDSYLEGKQVNLKCFWNIIGILLYLTYSRLDILFAVDFYI